MTDKLTLDVPSTGSRSTDKKRNEALKKIAHRDPELVITVGRIADANKDDDKLLKKLGNPFVKKSLNL